SINDRKSRLEVGYGLEPTLPDGFAGSVLRAMRPALRAGKYADALMSAAETIGQTVAKVKHTTIDTQLPPHTRQEPGGDFPWGAIIAGGVILLLIFRSRRPRGYGGGDGGGFLPGLILGDVLSRGSWGSRGSGGFGGSDSSDSFGGFGGGDSGGGGASSDW
ncbi:MAG TPA: TPM domain-containing protein, partial [Candidatus Acidoferrum sp.]|nr:TPM domain-containing protein [Candidatus Acidoferrum sp.]